MNEVQKTDMPANLDGFIGAISKNAGKMSELYEIAIKVAIQKDDKIKELEAKILELEKKE